MNYEQIAEDIYDTDLEEWNAISDTLYEHIYAGLT